MHPRDSATSSFFFLSCHLYSCQLLSSTTVCEIIWPHSPFAMKCYMLSSERWGEDSGRDKSGPGKLWVEDTFEPCLLSSQAQIVQTLFLCKPHFTSWVKIKQEKNRSSRIPLIGIKVVSSAGWPKGLCYIMLIIIGLGPRHEGMVFYWKILQSIFELPSAKT